ncbi:MAG: nuclease [Acidobacteriota bacterium]|nr:nuclease [Acidobacteriota bacterium]
MPRRIFFCPLICFLAIGTGGWGVRGHVTANRLAVISIPDDGPVFLNNYVEWIAQTGPVPDSWRGTTEPYSKLFEDPNHGWFKEQFAFMNEIPRSRYEFVLALYDEYLRIKSSDPERAKLTNVRWTGTLPYATMENYDRIKSAMRLYRRLNANKQDTTFLERDIAFYMGWMGHYTADGAQPLHDTIHHDGWLGDNPKGYTTDPRIHGRFETAFVDLIQLTEADLKPYLSPAKILDDPFAAVLAHLDDAATHVEEIYQMDKRGAFAEKGDRPAKLLVDRQLAKASALLRDLTYTAWIESGRPVAASAESANDPRNSDNPISPKNLAYNPATGTTPPLRNKAGK